MVLLLWRHIVMSDTKVAPEWHFCQTIVQYDITIVQYDITIAAPWCWSICYNIVWSIWYFESICTITEGHVTRNSPISLEYLHLTYNNIQIWTCDKVNMEFYGSEATILTKEKPRSILLPKIHKTYIADIIGQYLLYYMSNVYGSRTLVYC